MDESEEKEEAEDEDGGEGEMNCAGLTLNANCRLLPRVRYSLSRVVPSSCSAGPTAAAAAPALNESVACEHGMCEREDVCMHSLVPAFVAQCSCMLYARV